MRQIAFQPEPSLGWPYSCRGMKHWKLLRPRLLGAVHGGIRVRQQSLDRRRVLRVKTRCLCSVKCESQCPRWRTDACITSMIRFGHLLGGLRARCSEVTISTNSSPPRAGDGIDRRGRPLFRTAAPLPSGSSSPARCPRESFTNLKRSRSSQNDGEGLILPLGKARRTD